MTGDQLRRGLHEAPGLRGGQRGGSSQERARARRGVRGRGGWGQHSADVPGAVCQTTAIPSFVPRAPCLSNSVESASTFLHFKTQ